MNVNDVLLNILYLVISLAVTIGGAYAAKLIRTNTDLKYRDEIADAVVTATACVQQTFVDKAKESNCFGADMQASAREKAIDMAIELLSASAKDYLYHGRTENGVEEYLTVLIEESVRMMKREV